MTSAPRSQQLGARERTSFLGFPVEISDRDVVVFTPDGDRICTTTSVKQARLIVRGYRRETRRELSNHIDKRASSQSLPGARASRPEGGQ